MTFFTDQNTKFFQPLTGKHREQAVACLKALYDVSFSLHSTYTQFLEKKQVVEVFQENITRTPIFIDDETEYKEPPRNDREQALWIFNQLVQHGWLEERVDETILMSKYTFSRMGRIFTQAMVEVAGASFRTRHRNTRNTRNALSSFLKHGEVYDLLDAYEYSERIVTDFTDVIDELEESKRQIISETESSELLKQTTETFLEFMEKRFIPDISIRLSADSVEKYRDEIQQLIREAKEKDDAFKLDKEHELRKLAGELLNKEEHESNMSLYIKILNDIEHRIINSCEYMLPKLHSSLRSFTERVKIIISQLSFIHSGHQSRLLEICQSLSVLPENELSFRLERAGDLLTPIALKLPDASDLRLSEKRQKRNINTLLVREESLTEEQKRKLYIQNLLDESFTYHGKDLRDYIVKALSEGHRIRTTHLPVKDAKELIMFAHAIESGSAGRQDSGYQFIVEATGNRVQHEYFTEMDEFIISVKKEAGT